MADQKNSPTVRTKKKILGKKSCHGRQTFLSSPSHSCPVCLSNNGLAANRKETNLPN